MDEAEQWLHDHDPDYLQTSRAWHSTDDLKEVSVGSAANVEALPKVHVLFGSKACVRCHQLFTPREAKHVLCERVVCKAAARRDYQRDLMRRRRAA